MNIKRILSLIICMAMLYTCVFANADEAPTSNEIFGEYEMGFTNALEITAIEDVNTLGTDLTKGEFYKMICALGAVTPVESADAIFADLKPGDEYESHAKALYKAGYISTDMSGNIHVEKPISTNEAVALVVSVLGYGPKAKAEGGYPVGYLSVANRLKLTDGLNLGKTLTVGEGVVLIYNSFNVDMMVPRYTLGNKPTEYYVSEDTTILTSSFGAYHYEGIVEGVDITRIAGDNDVNPYRMDVSGKIFDIGYITNPYDFLGYEVEIVYITKRGIDPMIVHIAAVSSNTATVLDIEDITTISGGKVTAYPSGSNKKKNYSFEKSVPVVYNGAATEEAFNNDLIQGKIGTVKLLDNDGNNTADVVFVNAYENYYVGYADAEEYTIFDKYNKTNSISLDPEVDEPFVNIFDINGEEATFGTIKKGSVVSVYESLDDAYQAYITAYVSDTAVVGDIESVNTDERLVTIGETEYEVTKYAMTNLANILKPGISVRLMLDVTGKVAGGELEADPTFNYGFLIGSDSDEGFATKAKFRFYNTDGDFFIADAASNVRVDGNRYKRTEIDSINTVLHNAAVAMYGESVKDNTEFRASAVRFALNSNGEVSAIDTILDGATGEVATRATETSYRDSLFASYSADGGRCRTYSSGKYMTIGPKITIDGDKPAMFVPGAEEIFEDDDFSTDKASAMITNDKDYVNIWSFYSDKKAARADFAVVIGSAASGGAPHSSVRLAIVKAKSKVLGDDGEERDSVTVLHDGSEVKLMVSKTKCTITSAANEKDPELSADMTAADLKPGDVIRYSTNGDGELSNVELYYRCATDSVSYVRSGSAFGQQISIRYGYVYETLDGGFLVYYTDNVADLANATYDDAKMEFVTTAVVTSYFYKYDSSDASRPEVKNSSPGALKGYTDVGDEASRIIIHQHYGMPYGVVISE